MTQKSVTELLEVQKKQQVKAVAVDVSTANSKQEAYDLVMKLPARSYKGLWCKHYAKKGLEQGRTTIDEKGVIHYTTKAGDKKLYTANMNHKDGKVISIYLKAV